MATWHVVRQQPHRNSTEWLSLMSFYTCKQEMCTETCRGTKTLPRKLHRMWGQISTENPRKRKITKVGLKSTSGPDSPALAARTHEFTTWGHFLAGLIWLGLKSQVISSSITGNTAVGIFYDTTIHRILKVFKLKPKCYKKGLYTLIGGWNKWTC